MTAQVGIGFIGTGFAKNVQMPAFAECEGARMISVASGNPENARDAAERFSLPHFTGDWRETVAHPDVDLVCITTPPSLHREMVLFAIENGKNILAEKPMAMNLVEAEEMASAARESGLLALLDHELRYLPGRQTAREMIRSGRIGKIRHAKYNFRAPHRGDPAVKWNWWSDAREGGGSLGAINSHVIDSFHWFLETDISSVFCQLHTHIKKRQDSKGETREVTSDDEANMLIRFAESELTEDATGLVSVSMTESPEYLNVVEFFGADGAIRVGHRGELFVSGRSGDWERVETDLGEPIAGAADTGFSRGFRFFAPKIVEALAVGENTLANAATFDEGVRVQRVLDASRESNSKGISVRP